MIKFNYKSYSTLGTVMDFGSAGMSGFNMINSAKEHKANMSAGKEQVLQMEQSNRNLNKHISSLEKSFALPLAAVGTAASLGMTALGLKQSSSQAKDQKELGERQIAAQERQTRAIQRQNQMLQKMEQRGITSPEAVAPVLNKNFSLNRVFGENTMRVAKDFYKAGKSTIGKGFKRNLAAGALAAGAAYTANKIIARDMKKSKIDIDNSGNLVQKSNRPINNTTNTPTQRAYAAPAVPAVPSAMTKKVKKKAEKSFLGKLGAPVSALAKEAPRVIGYYAEKSALKSQIEGTQNMPEPRQSQQVQQTQTRQRMPSQRAYSKSVLSQISRSISKNWGQLKANPTKYISGHAVSSMSLGTLDSNKIQHFASKLAKGNSKLARTIGQYGKQHQTIANVSMLPVAAGIGYGAVKLGRGIVRQTTKALDPGAYKYQDTKDRVVRVAQDQLQGQQMQAASNYGQV